MTRTRAFSFGLVSLGLIATACVHGGNREPDPDSSLQTDARSLRADDAPSGFDATSPNVDRDGDGVPAPADCDDENDLVYPGAEEDCATLQDEDCDGESGLLDSDCDEDVDEDLDEDSDEN